MEFMQRKKCSVSGGVGGEMEIDVNIGKWAEGEMSECVIDGSSVESLVVMTRSYHLYANDTQIYIAFNSNESFENLQFLASTLDSVQGQFRGQFSGDKYVPMVVRGLLSMID